MFGALLYIVAIMYWFSRKVLPWRLSNTMDVYFGVTTFEEAITRQGRFTSSAPAFAGCTNSVGSHENRGNRPERQQISDVLKT